MDNLVLPLDAFIRSVGITKGTPHALFVGAGASISSGMPSGQMCIWEWKRAIFLTNNVGLEGQFTELSLTSVRQRIQRWLDKQGLYPPEGAPDEYSVYAEACFPIADRRRAYFQEKVRKAQPHTGYQLLCLLAEAELVKSVWTTNFDGLAARAAAAYTLVPIEIGIDSQERSLRAASKGELVTVSLHGDYRYDRLKNTTQELQKQEALLEESLITEYQDTPVIVCGYSGRDESIMRSFSTAYGRKGAGTLYWCAQDVTSVPDRVNELIALARKNGRDAYLVPIRGFDDLVTRLALHCLEDDGRKKANAIIASTAKVSDLRRAALHVDTHDATGVLKSNAFELECPSEVLAFELQNWPTDHVWKWVRQQTAGREVKAVPFRGQIFALGRIDDVKDCFKDNIKGKISRTPVSGAELRYEDGAIVSLMREALIRALADGCKLETDEHTEVWLPESIKKGQQKGVHYHVHESVALFLRHIDGRQFLVMKPSLKVLSPTGERIDKSVANPVKLAILGYQHNKEFNEAVNKWRGLLLSSDTPQKTYEYPPDCGSAFRFRIRRSPAFAQVKGLGGRPLNLDSRFRPLIKQSGIEIKEPELLFSNKAGNGTVRDVHPVRGVVNNRPFDYALTTKGFGSAIRLAVICPMAETRILQSYLQSSSRKIQPERSEADYLIAYPGFQNAFGIPLEIAQPGEPGWFTCPEPDANRNDHVNSVEIAKSINRGIEVLQASHTPHAVLIFYPERWSKFRRFENESEHFDVHDFVKAGGVQKGIGTQFLDQSTLSDTLQCRVWWWLSLAFYVKAMRTPWVLNGLSADTAFVGLGIARKPGGDPGKTIVMGCSHIYSDRGEGLQYRLSQVEDPVFIGRNPYLSREDARRVGEQIRELFFDSRDRLPSRVVIHKRTHFTADERLGLQEGLSGVSEVEMLEIVVDEALRYMASAVDDRGNLFEDNYPVRRGTAVKLDDFSALVWVHGVTSALSSGRRYYQGKRRIPAPLVVRRHAGASDLRVIAEEIVGLSKMNWNTFDLYTKLPATVQSSNEIARIGSLLQRFGSRSYDFRLFI